MTKTALITGASNGIGLEFAQILGKQGYNLVIVARSGDKLQALKTEMEKLYPIQVVALDKDLSQPLAAEWVFSETQKLNIHIDLLINNAGMGDFGSFIKTKIEKEEQMIMLNILALTKITKLYAQEMVKRKSGKILNVASTAAFQAGPLMAVYFATKAYVLSFTEALANEFQGTGVSITALCPGPTATGFIEKAEIQNQKIFLEKYMATSTEVAQFGLDSLDQGKVVAVHGVLNFLGTLYAKFLPRRLVTATFHFLITRK